MLSSNVPMPKRRQYPQPVFSQTLAGHTVWDRLVDLVTVIWLGMFFANIASPGLIPASLEIGLLSVFVADLVVKARTAPNLRTFVRTRWTDILMVVPYFRVLRILRLTRLLRLLRATRVARVGRFPGLKALEAFKRRIIRLTKRR